MSVCYFNDEYDKKYDCKYEINKDGIKVIVNYNIGDEIQTTNGIKILKNMTQFEKRDILVIDFNAKINYLLKSAYCSGTSEVLGTPDGRYETIFFANYYFMDSDYEKLCEISNGKNIKKIKIYSNLVNEIIGCPSLDRKENKKEYIIKLKRNINGREIEVNQYNIKTLKIADSWKSDSKNFEISINLNGYIEIELDELIDYKDIEQYMKELIIYFQLYKPCKLAINKLMVNIDNYYYELFLPIDNLNYKNVNIDNSVGDDILTFLLNCYKLIPYRNSKNEIRNIPYIILNTSRNIEDNFLMFYRFIECYYKQQRIPNIKKDFIKYSINNNYDTENEMNEYEVEKLTFEIISLRNHYAHDGYYIKDEKLFISFPKIEKKDNPKNHIDSNVNFDWIYKRTKILYKIVIDIIFRNMLQYDKYTFNKHF